MDISISVNLSLQNGTASGESTWRHDSMDRIWEKSLAKRRGTSGIKISGNSEGS